MTISPENMRLLSDGINALRLKLASPPFTGHRDEFEIRGSEETIERLFAYDIPSRYAGYLLKVDERVPDGEIRIVDPWSSRFTTVRVRL